MKINTQRAPLVVALLSAFIVSFIATQKPPALFSDPAWQLLAVQQYLSGDSPTPNHVSSPAFDEMTLDSNGWIGWWPPGPQLLATPLMAMGLSVAETIRVMAIICFFLGVSGWVYWFGLFDLSWKTIASVAVMLPWIRYANAPLFQYSQESFAFAIIPYLLIASDSLARDPKKLVKLTLTGLLLGSAYIFKYSMILVVGGLITFFASTAVLKHYSPLAAISKSPLTIGQAIVLGICTAVPIAALSYLNFLLGGSLSSATSSVGFNFNVTDFLALFANPALAVSDAGGLLHYLLLHPNHGFSSSIEYVIVFGIPGGLFLDIMF
ncbi:hypothetical protein ACFL1S_07120 [Pseudomonadota bacterium]